MRGRAFLAFPWVMALVVGAVACGGEDERPPPPGMRDSGPRDGGMDAAADAGWDAGRDAGTDGGPPDAGWDADLDGGPPDAGPCSTDEDCADGLRCNGNEICLEGRCVAGIDAVTCSDGITCTIDECTEPMGECVFTPDDSLCDSGQVCVTDGLRESDCIRPCSESTAYCELVPPQCGCSVGESCYVAAFERRCLVPGTDGAGSPCSMANECATGIGCRLLGGSVRMCSLFCKEDDDCGAGSVCAIEAHGDTSYCSRDCDPVAQTGCIAGAACAVRYDDVAGVHYEDCRAPLGSGGQGDACDEDDDCSGQFRCTILSGGDTTGVCAKYCDTSATTSGCPSGTSCTATTWSATVGGTTYGVCL